MKPTLYYDAQCPVCRSYVKMLQKKISHDKLDYLPIEEGAEEFQFVQADGTRYFGEDGVEQLVKTFPEINKLFWMLPHRYQGLAIRTTYKVGKIARGLFENDCDC